MKSLLAIGDLDNDQVLGLFQTAKKFKKKQRGTERFLLENRTLALLFFEPSTRTMLSFQKAMQNLGGKVLSLDLNHSSMRKGENLADTLRTLQCYADAIVLRHPTSGVLEPLRGRGCFLNGGDGSGEHPTQALLDLFTIWEAKGRVEDLTVVFWGDSTHSRAVRSLLALLERFPGNRCLHADDVEGWEQLLKQADVLYVVRDQKERWARQSTTLSGRPIVDLPLLEKLPRDALVMHPLPRNEEMCPSIDSDSRCAFFRQVENGVFIRMAVLLHCLG